jgi:hypothetical protein
MKNDESMEVTELEFYLKNINYPTNKEDLVDEAKKSNAPDKIITILKNKFPEKSYDSLNDVQKTLHNVRSHSS